MLRLAPILGNSIVFAVSLAPIQAQRVVASALESAPSARVADSTIVLSRKSPGLAGFASAILPGSGHIYAGEGGRGLAVMAIYFVAVPIVMGGRTDGFGKVAGITWLSTYLFGIIDGVNAVHRNNARVASAAK